LTGFIDAYIIDCYDKAPMLLPQNVVLSAQNSPTYVNVVEWHEKKLPTFSVSDPKKTLGVALIIEGEDADERFALMLSSASTTSEIRSRIELGISLHIKAKRSSASSPSMISATPKVFLGSLTLNVGNFFSCHSTTLT
jgi:hypothetical protein